MNPLGMNSLWQLGRAQVITAAPWWLSGGIAAGNCKGAYRAKGAASKAASYINLNNPGTNNITEGNGSATWSADVGWYPVVGAARWLNTNIVPTADYTLIGRFDSITPKNYSSLMGVVSSPFFNIGYVNYWYISIGNEKVSTSTATSGIFAIHNRRLYLNGVAITAQANTNTPTATIQFLPDGFGLPLTMQAGAVYDSITEAQMQAVTTAMQAL